jgi:hypothetical protein
MSSKLLHIASDESTRALTSLPSDRAVIEGDRPPAACIGNVLAADVDATAGVVAEIVDNDA